jgi:hypothetical protein
MPRPLKRASFDDGIRLDINEMLRAGVKSGRQYNLRLTDGQEARVELDMGPGSTGCFRFQGAGIDQTIALTAVRRHFGGRQWYWVCPRTNVRASVLWLPRWGRSFGSPKHWKASGAVYLVKRLSPVQRAHRGISRIENRLVSSEDGTMLHPLKWMRRRTFDRLCGRLDRYENTLNELCSTRLLAALGHCLVKPG